MKHGWEVPGGASIPSLQRAWPPVSGGCDDVPQQSLEVVDRRFAVGFALCRELAVEVFEERLGCADCSAFAGQGCEDASVSIRCCTRSRTWAKKSSGTAARSVTMLCSKTASC